MKMDFSLLNPSQRQAAVYGGGHLLIIAGPGTGKTHTLIHRAAHLLEDFHDAEKILAVTFTNKAAEEMRGRLFRLVPGRELCVTMGTFHQFALRLLRARASGMFSVLSPEDADNLAQELWPQDSAKERAQRLSRISRWKSESFDESMPSEVRAYNAFIREKNFFDFDDLLLEALRVVDSGQAAVVDIQHLFVDEYQDINRAQHALILALVRRGVVLTAIGDPNQAIYGFRGSDARYFRSFEKDFPGARVMRLSENYRSAGNLLAASGQVIAKGDGQCVPELTARLYAQGRLTIHAAATDKAEAEYVVHTIEKMVGGTSLFSQDSGRVDPTDEPEAGFGDIAVLYRLNSQARELVKAFDRSGIPYHVAGKAGRDLYDEVYPSKAGEFSPVSQKVSLMTLHAAKGLEFAVVFIVGCEEVLLPLDWNGLKGRVEEERRLFYVGMTRAKTNLFLLSARKRLLYGKTLNTKPSRFLFDMEEALKIYDVKEMKFKPKKEKQLQLF